MRNTILIVTTLVLGAACDTESLPREAQRANSIEDAPQAPYIADLEEARTVDTFLIEAEREAPEENLCFAQCGGEQEVFPLDEGEACGCGAAGLVVGSAEELEQEFFVPDELTAPSDTVNSNCAAYCNNGSCSIAYGGPTLCACSLVRCKAN